jgi:acetyltransferase-like isoleucine patch superfamily enzyme
VGADSRIQVDQHKTFGWVGEEAMGIGTIERLDAARSKLLTRLYTLLLASQFKQLGAGARISPPFRYHGLHQISLGEHAYIARDCWIHVLGDHENGDGSKITIHAHAGIGMGSHISAAQQVVIGEHALLAPNVYISDHAHAYENVDMPIMEQGITGIKPVSIGRNAWLGRNVVVLPGVSIGQNCVIGANSVVNSSIPDFSVAVGMPARVIKQYNRNTGRWERVP